MCRHENALLAKKARAMAGWLSAVHGSSSDEKMIIYEEAASALAKEIEAREAAGGRPARWQKVV